MEQFSLSTNISGIWLIKAIFRNEKTQTKQKVIVEGDSFPPYVKTVTEEFAIGH